jgi:hypothetical protein
MKLGQVSHSPVLEYLYLLQPLSNSYVQFDACWSETNVDGRITLREHKRATAELGTSTYRNEIDSIFKLHLSDFAGRVSQFVASAGTDCA